MYVEHLECFLASMLIVFMLMITDNCYWRSVSPHLSDSQFLDGSNYFLSTCEVELFSKKSEFNTKFSVQLPLSSAFRQWHRKPRAGAAINEYLEFEQST